MRRRTLFCAIGLALMSSGCTLVSNAGRSLGFWSHQVIQDSREWHRDRQLAEAAWQEFHQTAAKRATSADYAAGFKEGFAEHLFRGTAAAPPLPPKRYRELRYQTPEGFRAAEQWLAGFRHGIGVAQARGIRQFITGPSSLPAEPPPAPPEVVVAPLPAAAAPRADHPNPMPPPEVFVAPPPEAPPVPAPPPAPEPRKVEPPSFEVKFNAVIQTAAVEEPPPFTRLTPEGIQGPVAALRSSWPPVPVADTPLAVTRPVYHAATRRLIDRDRLDREGAFR